MTDDLDKKAEDLSKALGKGVTREYIESFYADFDEDAARAESMSHLDYEVLDPEAGKYYDENIETFSYILKRDGQINVFQPHAADIEGLHIFETEEQAESAAAFHLEKIASLEVSTAREKALVESLR